MVAAQDSGTYTWVGRVWSRLPGMRGVTGPCRQRRVANRWYQNDCQSCIRHNIDFELWVGMLFHVLTFIGASQKNCIHQERCIMADKKKVAVCGAGRGGMTMA